MPTVAMVEERDAPPEVRAVYDEIKAVKGIDFVPNFWKTLGSHPPLLEEVWRSLNRAMQPGRLDGLTKEMVALAVSATNGCTYCIPSHTAAARKLGMDDAMLGPRAARFMQVAACSRSRCRADGGGRHLQPDQSPRRRLSGGGRPADFRGERGWRTGECWCQ
jgi:AhpD family alkylhydroperoxidase